MSGARMLAALLALVAVVATAFSVTTAAARTDQRKKKSPPTLLWKTFPLAQRAKAAKAPKTPLKPPATKPRAATPPEPRVKAPPPPPAPKAPPPPPTPTSSQRHAAASYQISTDQPGFPRLLLVVVFLAGLLVVGAAVLVGRGLMPVRELGLRVAPAMAPRLARERRKRASRPTPPPPVTRCEIKLWRGFAKWHLYAMVDGMEDERIAESPFFRLVEADHATAEGLQALAALVEELEEDGWAIVSDGPAWYQHRLERDELR